MATRTQTQLVALVRFNLGNRTDKDDLIKSAIDLAATEIAKLHPWRSLRVEADKTINIGDTFVAVPDAYDLTEVRFIFGTMSYPLKIVRKERFTELFPNVASFPSSRPSYGYLEGGVFYFAPRVSQTYTLRFTQQVLPVPLGASDTLLFDADMAVVAWATSMVFDSMQMFEFSAKWDQRYAASLATAIKAEKRGASIILDQQPFGGENNIHGTPWLDPFMSTNTQRRT